jgi:hypothetical protein
MRKKTVVRIIASSELVKSELVTSHCICMFDAHCRGFLISVLDTNLYYFYFWFN